MDQGVKGPSLKQKAMEMRYDAPRILVYPVRNEGQDYEVYYHITGRRIGRVDVVMVGAAAVGDLLAARIVTLHPGMGHAYLEVRTEAGTYPAFLPLDRIRAHEPVYLTNRAYDGRLHQEDRILVSVTAEAYRSKPMRVSHRLPAGVEADAALRMAQTHTGGILHPHQVAQRAAYAVLEKDPGAKLLTEDPAIYEKLRDGAPEALRTQIAWYQDPDLGMTQLYGMTALLREITAERVYLKSGAEIVINRTEALTVIDVNTARSFKGKDREASLLAANLEATEEIAYQMEVRRISGIVIVDFISLKDKADEERFTDQLRQRLEQLTPPARFEGMTKLGLAEISRKREMAELWEYLPILQRTLMPASDERIP